MKTCVSGGMINKCGGTNESMSSGDASHLSNAAFGVSGQSVNRHNLTWKEFLLQFVFVGSVPPLLPCGLCFDAVMTLWCLFMQQSAWQNASLCHLEKFAKWDVSQSLVVVQDG